MNNEISPTVVAKWAQLRERLAKDQYEPMIWLLPLVEAIIERRIMPLHGLFPFTSHAYLNFSRTTLYPYASRNCPHVIVIVEGNYRVLSARYKMVVETYKDSHGKEWKSRSGENEPLGEAGLEETIRLLIDALPPDIGPALEMTGDELYRAEGIGLVEERDRQLREAVGEGKWEVVRDTLEAGAVVDAPDEDGFTHLMMAILLRRTELVRLLLAKGASTERENHGGETALSLARFVGDRYPEILRIVEQARRHQ